MHYPFNNQVALITGAGSGIGRCLSIEMAKQGAIIAALDLNEESLTSLHSELTEQHFPGAWEVGDVTDLPSLQAAVESFDNKLGPIDILVANAGIGLETFAHNFPVDNFTRQIEVNLNGVAKSIAAVLPGMIERKRGHLVAISSLASYRGLPGMAGYCASKSGVSALMESMRYELTPIGIDCTIICPGWIRTPLTDGIRFPKPGILEVDDAVQRMVRAIQKRKPFAAFPAWTRFLQSLGRWLPSRLSDWILRRYERRFKG